MDKMPVKTVEHIKQSRDPDLFVRELPKWQARRRRRESRRYPDWLIYGRQPQAPAAPKPRRLRSPCAPAEQDALLGLAAAVLAVCGILRL